MKKTCKTVGSEGKGKRRALKAEAFGEALKACLDGKNPEVWNFAYGLCRDAEEAQELVQEACYRALKARKSHDAARPVKNWLLGILRNAFLDSRQRKERRAGYSLDYCPEGGKTLLHETLAEKSEGLLERLERMETAAKVNEVLAQLAPIHRKALRLCDAQGLTYEEAARTLRVPEGTLRSRLHRARARFKLELRGGY